MVTLLFTDIEGGIGLWEAGPEAMTEASARYDRIVREQIEVAGGRVVKTVGEAFRTVFADPYAALASAMAIQRAAGSELWPPGLLVRVRMALHSGACVERDGDYFGPVANRADRLLAVGHGGQVLVSEAAYELLAGRLPGGIGFRDLGEHRLKDLGRAERVFEVTGPGLAGRFGRLRSLDDPALRHNLPSQPTSFVGRAAELAELRSLVSGRSRLVTIAGPGGIGKSRLALQVAAEALDGAGDGVWLVELAPVAEPELVTRTVAAVLGVREEPGRLILDTLVDAVGDRHLLVVLDNAEHVLGAAAKLADALMRSCPQAYLLVTSREPLGISGERVFRIPPLTVPPADLAAPGRLAAFESVQLFAERAAMYRQGFALDDANAAAVAAVCVRLDGIPLALELAAARLGSLSVPEIASRLDQRFRLLTGGSRTALPRHQTLRALINWSYDLLNPEEQMVLGRLSVFAGGWTLAAAETVTARDGAGEWQVLDQLAALVDKSLVQAEEMHGSTRYRMLETVRQYAAERLARPPGTELAATQAAHRDHYLALVQTADTFLRGRDEAVWLDQLEVEFDNIRAALAFSIADPDGTEPGLRLATGLRWFCNMRGRGGEILEALSVLLGRPDAPVPPGPGPCSRAATCAISSATTPLSPRWPARRSGSPVTSAMTRSPPTPSLSCAGSGTSTAICLPPWPRSTKLSGWPGRPRIPGWLPTFSSLAGRSQAKGTIWTAPSLTCERPLPFPGRPETTISSPSRWPTPAFTSKRPGSSRRPGRTFRRRARSSSVFATRACPSPCGCNSVTSTSAADPGSARRHFAASLDAARVTGVKSYVHATLLGLALAVGADGDHAVAATLHGVADEQFEQAGRAVATFDAPLRDRDQARLRVTLGDAAFEAAYRYGRTLSQTDGIALAVANAEPEPGVALVVPAGPLSEREREIVQLLARGATDAQIAERLFLSVNTVRSHLDRIRDKTGARRRPELVRYAVQAGIEAIAPPS